MREEEGVSKNIFLTMEEWQQRMDEARREIEAAQARLEESERESERELERVVAERWARDKRERRKA
jgi:hypothetical protein